MELLIFLISQKRHTQYLFKYIHFLIYIMFLEQNKDQAIVINEIGEKTLIRIKEDEHDIFNLNIEITIFNYKIQKYK